MVRQYLSMGRENQEPRIGKCPAQGRRKKQDTLRQTPHDFARGA